MSAIPHKKCVVCKCWRQSHLFLSKTCRELKSCLKCRRISRENYVKRVKDKKIPIELTAYIKNKDKIMNEEPLYSNEKKDRRIVKMPTVSEMLSKINNIGVDKMLDTDFACGYSRDFFKNK